MLRFLFVAVPIAELVVLWQVEKRIGTLAALALIFATGLLGAYLVQRQGVGVWRALRRDLAEGGFPGRRLAHGAMVLVGGALLLTPGLITDLVGFGLMVPTIRDLVFDALAARYRRRLRLG